MQIIGVALSLITFREMVVIIDSNEADSLPICYMTYSFGFSHYAFWTRAGNEVDYIPIRCNT